MPISVRSKNQDITPLVSYNLIAMKENKKKTVILEIGMF